MEKKRERFALHLCKVAISDTMAETYDNKNNKKAERGRTMEQLNKEIFEGTVEIVAAAMEEAEVELSAEGGERVGDFFAAIYRRLMAIASGEETARPAKPGAFEIFEDAKGEYRFRLKAGNG